MKSYFLDHVASIQAAEDALTRELPGQAHPWLVFDATGDPIAYLYVDATLEECSGLRIQADISGRHYNEDKVVIEVLQRLQSRVGGTISNDV